MVEPVRIEWPGLWRVEQIRKCRSWLPPGLRWTRDGGSVLLSLGSLGTAVFTGQWWLLSLLGIVGPFGDRRLLGQVPSRSITPLLRHRHGGRVIETLAPLEALPDGTPVSVQGEVADAGTIPGLLSSARGVYRSVAIVDRHGRRPDRRSLLFDVAEPFALGLPSGEQVLVDVAGARLLAPQQQGWPLLSHSARVIYFQALGQLRAVSVEIGRYLGWEHLVTAGDRIEVLGFKARRLDARAEALPRTLPTRLWVTHGPDHPLVIATRS